MDLQTQNIYQSMKLQHKDYRIKQQLLRFKIALLTLMIVSSISKAQNNTYLVKGSLQDIVAKKPVGFANVTLMTEKDSVFVKGGLSDTLGRFELPNISIGNYVIIISSVEYKKAKYKVEVSASTPTVDLGDLTMSQESKLLNEVTVSTQRLAFQPTAEGIIINMGNVLFKTSNNVVDVLRKSPSIQVKDDGSLLMKNSVVAKVLINGRNIPMGADELKNYLNTLKPDEVENIELITNPSAKYDAEYKGIINIKLKRDKELGLVGNVMTNFQQHKFASTINNINLVYKTPKIAYTARGGYSSVSNFDDGIINQVLSNGNKLSTSSFVPNRNNSIDYMFGIDYYLSKKQIIGGQIRAYQNNMDSPFLFDIKLNNSEKLMQSIISKSDVKTVNNNLSGNIYYEGVFKKGVVSFASSIVKYNNTQNQLIENKDASSTTNAKGDFINNTAIITSQLDYSPIMKKGKLDFGTKISFTDIDNDTKYQNLLESKWIDDKNNSNKFLYKERSLAAYISYANSLKKMSYMIGLRAENTETEGNSITLNTITTRNYTQILPSVGLNLPINDNNNLSLSYTKRLTRPSFNALNPFIYIGGPYSSSRGNQFLTPTITHSYSVNYNYKRISFAVNFGINYDDIQQVPFYDPVTNKTTYIFENLSSNSYRGVELGIPVMVTKWWMMQNNLKYYQNNYSLVFALPYFNGNVDTKIDYVGLSSFNAFRLPHGYNISLAAQWETGGGTALANLKPKGYVNIGVQKVLFKVINSTLSVNDIFRTYIVNATTLRPDIINFASTNKFGSQFVSLQLGYAFGKSTHNAKQVKISSQEEENRARR
jgi:outer membrane receptor protein involved in Fe transport